MRNQKKISSSVIELKSLFISFKFNSFNVTRLFLRVIISFSKKNINNNIYLKNNNN
jgi:hypothetical protein